MKMKKLVIWFFIIVISFTFLNKTLLAGEVEVIDSRHYSNVFGEMRSFRVFLPVDYYSNPEKEYPVIYYYHGWSQRYFGSGPDSYSHIEKGDDNDGDNIANFVARNDVIVIKPDGYNRSVEEEYYLRPYNVLPVETFRQFPIYFPELVNFIDANYKTIADREHRAISGLSMGGFMSMWVGGKYPHLVSAVGNFCGSAEFVVGPKDFPVEYRNLEMYKNYKGLNVRLNYGDKDFIRYYHRDMNRVWTQVMDNYEFEVYDAEHSTCGLGDMFGFIMRTFDNPPEKPVKWDHIDVYPEFSVWDYQISSDRDVPGFTVLENVNKHGFRSTVREHVPDGEVMPYVNITVCTAPVYGKDQSFIINDYDFRTLNATQKTLKSDNTGRLKIDLNGGDHEIGINSNGDGVPNPGESIVVLVKDMDKLWRTGLRVSDQYINPKGVNKRISDFWGAYDHVGGSVKYSVPLISSDCPENHVVVFIAEYWLPDYPNHIIKQKKVSIKVKGKDSTPPDMRWVRIPGDNIIQAKLYDGSEIKNVHAKLMLKDDPDKYLEVELLDNGLNGDKTRDDNVFSYTIPEQRFGLYQVEIKASDSFGNKMTKKDSGIFVLH
jgi:poly(3-hydroxybutyrate) depolymerase